jgi:hypothetical protein
MLRWFRLHASRVAAIAIAAMAAAGGSAIRPHTDDCHDGPCSLVQHDASAHRIGGAQTTDAPPLHCVVCHWAQSFRPRPEPRVTYVPAVSASSWVAIAFLTASVSTLLAQPPLRAPPDSQPLL